MRCTHSLGWIFSSRQCVYARSHADKGDDFTPRGCGSFYVAYIFAGECCHFARSLDLQKRVVGACSLSDIEADPSCGPGVFPRWAAQQVDGYEMLRRRSRTCVLPSPGQCFATTSMSRKKWLMPCLLQPWSLIRVRRCASGLSEA